MSGRRKLQNRWEQDKSVGAMTINPKSDAVKRLLRPLQPRFARRSRIEKSSF
jgi:hypothetical protein